jgi:heme-degrading monooxygenase HmoA
MYVRVTRTRVDPARLDEVNQLVLDVAAAAKRLPGNQSLVFGQDRATGEGVAVTTWDTEDHARWSRDVLGDLIPRLQALGVQFDPPQIFEVTAT